MLLKCSAIRLLNKLKNKIKSDIPKIYQLNFPKCKIVKMLGFPRGKSRNDVEIRIIYIIHTYMYIIVHHMLIVTL